jgi:hypothetical protein
MALPPSSAQRFTFSLSAEKVPRPDMRQKLCAFPPESAFFGGDKSVISLLQNEIEFVVEQRR